MYVGMLAFWSAILVVVRGPPCNTACGEFCLILTLFLVMPGVCHGLFVEPYACIYVCMYVCNCVRIMYVCMSLCTR